MVWSVMPPGGFPGAVRDTATDMGLPVRYVAPDGPGDDREDVARMSLANMYRRVPEVRTVVGFIARAVGSVPVHVFERHGDDRQRARTGPVVDLLGAPSPGRSALEWVEGLTADLALFDRCYCRKVRDGDGRVVALVRLPPPNVTAVGDGLVSPDGFDVIGARGVERVAPDDLLWIAGHDPAGGWQGAPVLDALRDDLAEARELSIARRDAWRKGPRASAVVTRGDRWPSAEARDRFLSGLRQFSGDGARAGSTLLLEDGMGWHQLNPQTFRDSQAIEGRGMVRQMVASAYGVPLSLIGDSDGSTYSTATAQRRALYSETLASWFQRLTAAINDQVVSEVGGPGVFVEFAIESKMRGQFEEQASVISTSVGAPWMTRNEARARMNLPAVEDGDELVTPLNVLTGGQASPADVDGRPADPGADNPPDEREKARSGRVRVKSGDGPVGELAGTVEDVLRRHFGRQANVVLAALANGDAEWWDGERWDRELADDLFDVAHDLTGKVGPSAARDLGFDPEAFDLARTLQWLRAVMGKRAEWINAATRDQVAAAVDGLDDTVTPESVFDQASTTRTVAVAAGLTATVAGFASTEAARQLAPGRASKTWVVHSGNPRSSHAAMDGETVGVGDVFSNGMQWPGDPVGGVDEVAGCVCGVEVAVDN